MKILPSLALLLLATPAFAIEPLTVEVDGIRDNGRIKKVHSQCIATIDGKSTKGENLRPTVRWTSGPDGTKSYALVMSDPDVPADTSKAGKDGITIANDAARQTFYHWVQFNITPDATVIPGGKMPLGFGRSGANYMQKGADSLGYLGPCPPWNDARLHHYHFTVYALDVAKLMLPEGAPTADVLAQLEKHTLAQGETVGTFSLYSPSVEKSTVSKAVPLLKKRNH